MSRMMLVAAAAILCLVLGPAHAAEARKLVTLTNMAGQASIATLAGAPDVWTGVAGSGRRPFTFSGATVGDKVRGSFVYRSWIGELRGVAQAHVAVDLDGRRTWVGTWTVRRATSPLRGLRGRGTIYATLAPLGTVVDFTVSGWVGY